MDAKLILAALLALVAAPPALADPYAGPVSVSNCAGGFHAGSACLAIPAGAAHVAPFVQDAAFGAEAGTVSFVSAAGGASAGVPFCPGDVLAIPGGATRVIVQVADPATAFTVCGLLGAGVAGQMGATFR